MDSKSKYVRLLGIIVLGALSFSSCSDDGDDNGGSVSKTVGVLDESKGLRIASAGGYNYVYQEDGRLLYVLYGSHSRCEFSYNPNKIVAVDDGDYDEAMTVAVSYNGSGYVSSESSTARWENGDGSDWEEESNDVSYSYDSNGHLTKINGSYKETEHENGKTNTESGTETYTLTWNNNLLQKVVRSGEGRDVDGPLKYVETYTLIYSNDAMANNANKYLQYACFVNHIFDNGFMEMLSYVGLLGKGPAFLPSGLEYESTEEYYNQYGEKKSDESSGSYRYSYVFNSDGAIGYDYCGSYRTIYSYSYVESSGGNSSPFTRATVEQPYSPRNHQKHLGLRKLHVKK